MHSEHRKILREFKKRGGRGNSHSSNDSYLKSGHRYYDVPAPERRHIAKEWLRTHRDITEREFISVIDSLFAGESHEEKTIASILLAYHKKGRAFVTLTNLDTWLDRLAGWAEIDALCANVFTTEELQANWNAWKRFIETLSKDSNIHKRRAALVFLTGPVHYSNDPRIQQLAFSMIERLKGERDILITKAISWLLREMVAQDKEAVHAYVEKEKESLPKIAVRETLCKITTGRKN